MKIFQISVRFLGHDICYGSIKRIDRAIAFADKFPDEIRVKKQLQRFLGSLNYVSDFYKELAFNTKILYEQLRKKKSSEWSDAHTRVIKNIKQKFKEIPCLSIADPHAKKIVETDASNIGYGGILKQKIDNKEVLIRYTSGVWKGSKVNYSTIKKKCFLLFCVYKSLKQI